MFEKMGDKYPNNSEKKQVIEQQSYLFDDLIFQEILTRLPIKSVIRFKSVSKQWYSTLSSSDFASAHLIKSPFPHPSVPVNTLFIKCRKNCYLFSYDDDDQISGNSEDNLVKLDVEFGVEKDDLELTGCCNGLVCLTPKSGKYFILWNPASRKLHKYESDGYLKHFDEADRVVVTSGFGYASSVDDYKYIAILTVYPGNTDSDNVCIFSLRENRWRKIDFNDSLALFRHGVHVGEKLYWLAYSRGAGSLLVSFDLLVERFDVVNINWDGLDLLGVMRGCLSQFNCNNTYIGDQIMHILEPPAIVKSIGLPNGLKLDPFSQMIGFTKTGKFFMTGPFSYDAGHFPSRSLGIVDTCARPMKYTMLLRVNESIEIARYVPSLLSPFPIEEPSDG